MRQEHEQGDGGKRWRSKSQNYALRADMTREEFIKEVTDGLAPASGILPNECGHEQGGLRQHR